MNNLETLYKNIKMLIKALEECDNPDAPSFCTEIELEKDEVEAALLEPDVVQESIVYTVKDNIKAITSEIPKPLLNDIIQSNDFHDSFEKILKR